MSEWHGYTQPRRSHPDYPWWTIDVCWRRTDGAVQWPHTATTCPTSSWVDTHRRTKEEMAPVLAAYDREHPLPAPPPRCGQVWVWPDRQARDGTPLQGVVDSVTPIITGRWLVAIGEQYASDAPIAGESAWPPPGALLVSGEGAPWMDTSGVTDGE
jgi:hypothetical protein